MSELNQLIGFLEEQLTVSEPTPDYTRHNQEIITYIEYLKSMKQPQLNENQQIVLDWLKKHFYKEDDNYPLVSVCRFVEEDTGDEFSDVGLAYGYLTMKQEAQVLLAFANWTMEQEE